MKKLQKVVTEDSFQTIGMHVFLYIDISQTVHYAG